MSSQVSELKMIVRSSSNLSSTSGLLHKDSQDDGTSTFSNTSTDSEFTFPAPVSTPANPNSLNPGAFHPIVQDLSAAEVSGQSSFPRVFLSALRPSF